jgi:hypothetical protein
VASHARSDWSDLNRDADRSFPWRYRIPYAQYGQALAPLKATTACTADSNALLDLLSGPQIPHLRSHILFERDGIQIIPLPAQPYPPPLVPVVYASQIMRSMSLMLLDSW